MIPILLAALAVSAAPEGAVTGSGALGALSLPTTEIPEQGRAALGFGLDYWRGGHFLLPDATSRRLGLVVGVSAGLLPYLEAYGSVGLRSTSLSSSAARRTLVSAGDLDLGLKLRVPGKGPLSAALLLEADLPSGVGGFSLQGTGGRAAAILGWSGNARKVPVAASISFGYRIDNSGRLSRGQIPTLPAFALSLASYDRVEAGASLQLPFRAATPAIELSVDAAVARQQPLPAGDHPLRSRLLLGVSRVRLLPSLSFSAGLQLSLARTGRLDERALPMQGLPPDPPWTILGGLTWAFELPRLPARAKGLAWHEPQPAAPAEPAARPAAVQLIKTKAVLQVVVIDAKTALPLAGAWVSFLEGSDVGATTGPEGRARVEADAGQVTLAVARDGYELLTEPVALIAGEEKLLSLQLQPVAPDATVRGKLVGEDGAPLRAVVLLIPDGTLALPGAASEPQTFEGSFAFQVPHGRYALSVYTPGYRGTPATIEVRPGETASHDLVLRRIAGEPLVRLGPAGIELSQPVGFAQGRETVLPAGLAVLAELAQALRAEKRALIVEARVDPYDLSVEARDGGTALLLSEARALAVVEILRERGVKLELAPRGKGLARIGQPLLELRPAKPPADKPGAT